MNIPRPTTSTNPTSSVAAERAAELDWSNNADATMDDHHAGRHDGTPDARCTHRQCRKQTAR